eukprot:COSAG02_NODE_7466_length_2999_cov_3.327931_1_plen_300_part_00
MDLGPSESAVQAMQDECFNSSRYAEDVSEELRGLLADKERVAPNQIVLGLGGGMILESFVEYLDSVHPVVGGEVVWPQPTYVRLVRKFENMGGSSVPVDLTEDMQHDLPGMAAAITERTRCVYVCNPNNPTGTCCHPEQLRHFVIEASKRCPVFLDEAYLECSVEFEARTLVDLVREGHDVCLMRTFSKIYGMAGQRIGYGVMPQHMADGMTALPQHMWTAGNLNRIGVVGAIASLRSENYVDETRAAIKAERDQLETLLGQLGRPYVASHSNFVWFETGMPPKHVLSQGVSAAMGGQL